MAARIRVEFVGGPRDGEQRTVETLVDRVVHLQTRVLPDGTPADSIYNYHLESVRRGVFRYVLRI